MPTILDSLFHKAVDMTSSLIGVEGGGGEPRNSGTFQFKKLYGQMASIQLHISQNVATSMSSLTSQSCAHSLPAVCLAMQVGSIYRPPEHWWTLDRLVNEASVK